LYLQVVEKKNCQKFPYAFLYKGRTSLSPKNSAIYAYVAAELFVLRHQGCSANW